MRRITWARVLIGLGHEVKLVAPEAIKPFVKKGKKNDAADAAAICQAACRPDIHFVPVKSLEQQGMSYEPIWWLRRKAAYPR